MHDITRYLGEPVGYNGTTSVTYNCPCCNKPSLKVNIAKDTRPYKCWSGGCATDQIRKALRLKVDVKSEIIRPRSLNIKPIKVDKIDPLIVSDYIAPITIQYKYVDNKDAIVTTYKYGGGYQVERIDFNDGSKKKFLPSYIKEGKRVYGADYNCPLFNLHLLSQHNKVVYLVEGEKCAITFTKELGLVALTVPGFGWNDKYLRPKLQQLTNKISGLIIVPDNDKPGLDKASLVRITAWSVGLPCNIVKFPEAREGEDIVDLLARNVDVIKYLK